MTIWSNRHCSDNSILRLILQTKEGSDYNGPKHPKQASQSEHSKITVAPIVTTETRASNM